MGSLLGEKTLRLLFQWNNVQLDPAVSKIKKLCRIYVEKKSPENTCHVTFGNKAIVMINLPPISNSANVKYSFVTNRGNLLKPSFVYLIAPICCKIFHFKNFFLIFILVSFLLIV